MSTNNTVMGISRRTKMSYGTILKVVVGMERAPTRKVALANEEAKRTGLISLANELMIGSDGWVKLASYRDYPLSRTVLDAGGVEVEEKYIQRVTPESAARMAKAHNSFFGKVLKLRRGAPIRARHTDRWDVAAQEGVTLAHKKPAALENSSYGIFAQLDARADGLYGLPIFEAGAQQIIERDKLKYFSPFWWTDMIGLENSIPVVEPTELISVALTDSPNLKDSPALSNARENKPQPQKKEDTMLKKIIALMTKFGIALANESETEVESKLPELETKLSQRAALENEKTTQAGRITALENEVNTEKTDHGKTKTALANETSEANGLAIDLAIAEGRIAPSERNTRLEALKTGGSTGRKALLNETVKFKVTPVTTDARRSETAVTDDKGAQKAARRLVALGNELFSKGGFATNADAYGAAKETEEGRKLVQQLEDYKASKE
jgi:hypothetical protein